MNTKETLQPGPEGHLHADGPPDDKQIPTGLRHSELAHGWHLAEGELSAEHLRGLGHLLYRVAFNGIHNEHRIPEFHRGPFGEVHTTDRVAWPENASTMEEFERFMGSVGLNTEAIRRLVHAASLETATVQLHQAQREIEQRHRSGLSSHEFDEKHRAAAARVAVEGLQAPLADHDQLVRRDLRFLRLPLWAKE